MARSLAHLARYLVFNEDDWGRVSCGIQFHIVMPIETVVLYQTSAYNLYHLGLVQLDLRQKT